MNYQTRIVLILTLVTAGVPATSHARVERVGHSHIDANLIVLRTSELRSAYLIRAGAVHCDVAEVSPQGIQHQLQRHFDVVLALLTAATPTSLDIALDRLERSSSNRWSAAERKRYTQYLLNQRVTQLVRLKSYRDRGVFPINEREDGKPTPIFVDNYGTACAVGHLMRSSGWEREVASIKAENNLVYVPDIAAGAVARWLLTSGLTIEEAALIQPSYGPIIVRAPRPDDAIKVLESNWSGVVDDLRFSNFHILEQSDVTPPTINILVSHRYCSWFSCVLSDPANSSRVLVQFDVDTISPYHVLSMRPYGEPLLAFPGERATYYRNEIGLFLSDDQADIFLDPSRDDPNQLGPVLSNVVIFDLQPFEPTSHMTVVTEILVNNGVPYESQRLHFEVATIPEPSAVFLFVYGCTIIVGCQRRGIRFIRSLMKPN